MAAQSQYGLTPEQYLEIERKAEYKSDFINGVIFTRAGAPHAHNLVVTCGEPKFHDNLADVLQNPTVIFEVLSPSTEGFDHGINVALYRRIKSLQDYVLVSTSEHRIEHFARQEDDTWVLRETFGVAGDLIIHSIDVSVPLAEIYDQVEFGEPVLPGLD